MIGAGSTYAELAAARDAGLLTNTDYARAMRAEHRAAYDTARACRHQGNLAAHYRQAASRFCALQRRYCTATLEATVAADPNGSTPDGRYARTLLKLGTVGERLDAWMEAHRFMNATGSAGRPSDALATVVHRMTAGAR